MNLEGLFVGQLNDAELKAFEADVKGLAKVRYYDSPKARP